MTIKNKKALLVDDKDPTKNPDLVLVQSYFDSEYYAEQCPDLKGSNVEAFEHFLKIGHLENKNPNAWFDTKFYKDQYPDIVQENLNPLEHYILNGQYEKRMTSPLDLELLEQQKEILETYDCFDKSYYNTTYPDIYKAQIDPLEHFLKTGCLENRKPNSWFDTKFYKEHYPDAAASELNPLIHYLLVGQPEKRKPSAEGYNIKLEQDIDKTHAISLLKKLLDTLFSKQEATFFSVQRCKLTSVLIETVEENLIDVDIASIDELKQFSKDLDWQRELTTQMGYFDEDYYLATYPDTQDAKSDPLEHFLKYGYKEKYNPHSCFDVSFYLSTYLDDKNDGSDVNALLHYICIGETKDYSPHRLFDVTYYNKQRFSDDAIPQYHKRALRDFLLRTNKHYINPNPIFDGEYYLEENPDVAETKSNPFLHYLKHGWKEQRDPHPLFSIAFYKARTNLGFEEEPLQHYLRSKYLDMSPHPAFNARGWLFKHPELTISKVKPLQHFVTSDLPTEQKEHYLHPGYLLWQKVLDTVAEYESADLEFTDVHFETIENPLISVIIPVYNQVSATLHCLYSIMQANSTYTFEVIIIDDASPDKEAKKLSSIKGLNYILNDYNLGYLLSCNKAAFEARGKYIVQLNNDTIVLSGWLEAMVETFKTKPKAGLVGARLIYPNGNLQEAGGVIWSNAGGLNFGHGVQPFHCSTSYLRQVDYCSGAAIMLTKELWDNLGGYDEKFAPAYYEDTDLAFRVRQAGYQVWCQPLANIIHFEGLSSGVDEDKGTKRYQKINREKFAKRWEEVLSTHTQEHYRDRYTKGQVLFIDAYTPTPNQDSGSLDVMNFINFFLACEYKVSFLPILDPVHSSKYTEQLQNIGVECITPPAYSTAHHYLTAEGSFYNLVFLYRAHVTHAFIDAVRELCPQARIVYDTVDLHYLRVGREAQFGDHDKSGKENLKQKVLATRQQEVVNMLKADATILLSSEEFDILKEEVNPELLHVIPIARSIPGTKVTFKARKDILFLGGFLHSPNIDSVKHLAQEIMPILAKEAPKINLRIVGSNPTQEIYDLACTNIQVDGYVEDLSGILDSVRMLVAPLRIGAGMKGKVISAISHGLPCVLSSVAAEGMALENNKHALIGDNPKEVVRHIKTLYKDEQFWQQVSKNALEFAQQNFSIQETYNHLYELLSILKAPKPKHVPQA